MPGTHNAVLGRTQDREVTILAAPGPHIVRNYPKDTGAEMPMGLLVALDGGGVAHEYDTTRASNIGTGDGATKTYAATLGAVVPGTVSITDGTETFTDDGFGTLTGSAAGTGKVNYLNGAVSVIFHANVANAAHVAASRKHPLKGAVARPAEAEHADAEVCVFGPVNRSELRKGDNAPGAADLTNLENTAVWAVG